jgi:hypothetical protein
MCQAAQKAAAENKEQEEVGVRPLFPQTMGLTPLDGPALPETSQGAVETMRRPKARD